jgi:hypothetical protein
LLVVVVVVITEAEQAPVVVVVPVVCYMAMPLLYQELLIQLWLVAAGVLFKLMQELEATVETQYSIAKQL